MEQISPNRYHAYSNPAEANWRPQIPTGYSNEGTHNGGEPDGEKSYFEEDRKKTICGLSPKIFWILVAVSITLVIGGAIGGGVAAAVLKKHHKAAGYGYSFCIRND
jgi:hypothetical protein